jgi:microcystin-dependent protein
MSSTGINTLTSGTINGLTSLDLTDLTTNTLNADNIDGDFFSIETIEANDIQVDNELELTNNGFITIGKGSGSEITITDTQIGYLDGITSNIQTQINTSSTDTSQLRIDLTEAEDDINANSSLLGLQGATIDDLYSKTILQSGDSITQKTTFSGKIILSSLSNLDVGVEIGANTANVGILTTQQNTNTADIATNTSNISTNTTNISSNLSKINTNTSNISSLSTQQSTNTSNIQNNALSIGQTSGGPVNSLFDRVKYITTATNNTYLEKALTVQTTGSSVSKVQISEGEIYIYKDDPELYFYRNDRPFSGPSAYLNVSSNGQFNIINYQKDRNIVIGTAGGTSTSSRIDINSNNVYINSVDVNNKFNTIDSDILGNSNAITSSNVSIANNLSKITTNTNSINDLQTKVAPVGSIMIYAGSSSPTGWYICDGALISKSSNIELWSLIGNTYLAGRSAQTLSFYLPDLRQLFITGAGDNSTYAVNATNKSVGDYNAQSIMEHGHNYERPTNTFKASQSSFGTNVWRSNTQSTTSGGVILPGGGGISTSSENKPYCMAMNYIIKK